MVAIADQSDLKSRFDCKILNTHRRLMARSTEGYAYAAFDMTAATLATSATQPPLYHPPLWAQNS
jgi:hypothetical protein